MESKLLVAGASLLILPACAATTGSADIPLKDDQAYQCRNDALESFVGQTATNETGAAIVVASGAKTLRWAPPRTAMTMDYRPDRVTVSYGDDMVIDRASCG